ncbi:MAG: hypothetical protein ISR47_03020 [Rhodospirillales bacterium]|nr:hypothetical protein [Rhodospirillales bacterium]
MKKTNIKTLGELIEKENQKTGDVKRMIDRYGVYYRNRLREWEAAPKDASGSEQMIDAAISALGSYADMFDERTPMDVVEEYYRNPHHHDIYRFGFQANENGELFVEQTRIQTLEDQIERLKEENKRLGGNYEPSIDKALVAPELELANQVYREALEKTDPKTNKVEGKTPREWMLDRLSKIDESLGEATMLRIASVANWDKKQTNKSKK